MPVDHKRINGPDESVPYQLYARLNTRSLEQRLKDASKDNFRQDSRKFSEQRKIFLKTGVVSQAKGSSYIEQGMTKLIVSVFDPREIPNRTEYRLKGELYCEFKFAPFSCPKRRLHQQDSEEKEYSSIMKKALESTICLHELPNFQVDVYALVLSNDGSAVSAAITAAGLALSEAGIPMYDIVTSVTLGIQHNIQFLDPTWNEEELCKAQITSSEEDEKSCHGFVILSKLNTHQQVCQFHQTGNIAADDLSHIITALSNACDVIVPLIQKCLVKSVVKDVESNKMDI
ncbi:exosome complex component MTR3-like [Cylas formicarius]|uniref:exosome complex component MTR3-like n=1 Tax=Cylas formicarius TaxID=197179 RepID=UPI00295852E2|nr:exosome complex component MTR3-like [Cylas formicarius]